jgi:holo-[acyl-carrier protein] synthase
MIIGVGSDIIHIDRIGNMIKKFGNKFLTRIYADEEISLAANFKSNDKQVAFYAKRFAAKEAFAKAIGIGIRTAVNFKDISVTNDNLGKPIINTYGKAKELTKNFKLHISLSDDKNIAQAFVILEQ